jgi:hypothetical protein
VRIATIRTIVTLLEACIKPWSDNRTRLNSYSAQHKRTSEHERKDSPQLARNKQNRQMRKEKRNNEIDFTRNVEVVAGGRPGGLGLFGAGGALRFSARRVK